MKFLKVDEETYINIDKIILIEHYKYFDDYNYLDYTIIHFEANQHSKCAKLMMKIDVKSVYNRIENLQNNI